MKMSGRCHWLEILTILSTVSFFPRRLLRCQPHVVTLDRCYNVSICQMITNQYKPGMYFYIGSAHKQNSHRYCEIIFQKYLFVFVYLQIGLIKCDKRVNFSTSRMVDGRLYPVLSLKINKGGFRKYLEIMIGDHDSSIGCYKKRRWGCVQMEKQECFSLFMADEIKLKKCASVAINKTIF